LKRNSSNFITALFAAPLLLVAFASAGLSAQENQEEPAAERPPTQAEQLAFAERVLQSAEQTSAAVSRMIDQSRSERDLIRMSCLNDKLSQVGANSSAAQGRSDALRSAVEAGDTTRANHEYTVLSVLLQKLELLRQEAGQCIGQDVYETGAARITVEVDAARIPALDPQRYDTIEAYPYAFFPPPTSPAH